MNYIKRLQERVNELESKLKEANSATMDLYSYCASEKFQGPAGYGGATYINKQDIFLRLEPIFKALHHD